MRLLRVLFAFALMVTGVVSTVGSGGGGNDGIGNVDFVGCCSNLPPPLPPPEPGITIDNAPDASATVVQAITQLIDVAAIIGGETLPNPPAAPDLLSSHSKFELIARVAATGEDVTVPCAVSGTVRARGIPDNAPASLSAGDQFDLVFDACDDGDGYTLDGRLAQVLVRELEGDPRTDVFRIRYEFLALFTAGTYSYFTSSSQTGFILDWDSLAFPVIVLTATPGDQLILNSYADNYYAGYFWSSEQAGKHSLTVNADVSIPATLVDARASVMRSDVLGGLVSYEVIVPLQAPDGQDPESGEILISAGAGHGSVRLVIESSAPVRLEIDSDDDGLVDDYQYTTWSALLGGGPT